MPKTNILPVQRVCPIRECIKEPVPAVYLACELLSAAVEAHLADDVVRAERLFVQANSPEAWHWLTPSWTRVELNVLDWFPPGDTAAIPRVERDPDRSINRDVRAAVLRRDGFRCRYCGLPVISAEIRGLAHRLYPAAVPWDGRDPSRQHAGFQCLWLQYDHVEPHSHGGRSSEDNVVITCGLCNFGKHGYTLRQLGLSDPRLRPPVQSDWDGLERLRKRAEVVARTVSVQEESQAYFLPNASLRGGYLMAPAISGKERWFKLGPDVEVSQVTRRDVPGYRVVCAPRLLKRRGILPESLIDFGE